MAFSYKLLKIKKKPDDQKSSGSSSWRKGRDSNPRYGITVYRISSPAHSTTLPPFPRFLSEVAHCSKKMRLCRSHGLNFFSMINLEILKLCGYRARFLPSDADSELN